MNQACDVVQDDVADLHLVQSYAIDGRNPVGSRRIAFFAGKLIDACPLGVIWPHRNHGCTTVYHQTHTGAVDVSAGNEMPPYVRYQGDTVALSRNRWCVGLFSQPEHHLVAIDFDCGALPFYGHKLDALGGGLADPHHAWLSLIDHQDRPVVGDADQLDIGCAGNRGKSSKKQGEDKTTCQDVFHTIECR